VESDRFVVGAFVATVHAAVDVTGLAIGVTVALGVGILLLLIVLAAYLQSRRRVQQLRQQLTTSSGAAVRRQRTSTSRVRLPENILEFLKNRRRDAAAANTPVKFVLQFVIVS